jgi:predicted RND superfamily exporter protein
LIHRWLESSGDSWKEGLLRVNRGIVLAALTTLVSFGTLVFSGYPGLQSMGAVALMGVGFSALIAVTLVPVLLRKLNSSFPRYLGRRWERSAESKIRLQKG